MPVHAPPALVQPAGPETALQAELARRPAATAADLYKLLHQSVYGPGHLIPDLDSATRYLLQELAEAGPTMPGEALCEDLGNGMVRVNLRPFRDRRGAPAELVRAMAQTARVNRGEARTLEARLDQACRQLEAGGRAALAAELRALTRAQAARGHPALHHSEAYQRAYRPAYRVVQASLLEPLQP